MFCGQTGNAQKQFSLESLQSYIDATVRKIRDGHEKREEILETRLRKLKASIKDLVRRHEKLLSAYRCVFDDNSYDNESAMTTMMLLKASIGDLIQRNEKLLSSISVDSGSMNIHLYFRE